mmetsp:Transcript_49393/g.120557  ORF Transcript_49393/g.120557 Transcript_49393/m.120557 type:complete len:433 (-) Transcript_49393:195-1493(-)
MAPRVFSACLALGLMAQASVAFLPATPLLRPGGLRASRSAVANLRAYTEPSKKWQDLAEQIADPFVNPLRKPSIAAELLGMRNDVAESLQKVVRREVPVEEELLGDRSKKQLKATRAVSRQIVEDIIPSAMDEFRTLRDSDLQATGSRGLQELQKTVTSTIDDLSADGKFPELPSVEEIRKTIRQEARAAIFGELSELEQPMYAVVSTTPEYEIRDYENMTLATRYMGNQTESYTQRSGRAFNALAGFLFGKNSASRSMSMTTPVFMQKGEDGEKMSFVIPTNDAADVPTPTDDSVTVETMEPVRVAVREFPGFATSREVVLQKAALISALEADGFTLPETLDVTVAQYNPPYTLPTVRKNEVLIKLDPSSMPDPSKSAAAIIPEAPASEDIVTPVATDYITTTGVESTDEPGWDVDEDTKKPGSGSSLDDL